MDGRSPAYSLATVRKPKNHRVHHLHRVGLTRRDLVRGNLWLTGKFLKRKEVDVSDYPVTHDGRYFVLRGRLWRKSDPALAEVDRQRLVKDLMSARRSVRDAKGNFSETAKAAGEWTTQKSLSANVGQCGGTMERRISIAIWSRTRLTPIGIPALPILVDFTHTGTHLARMPKDETSDIELMKTWTLTPAATLGSAVRAKGILLELRARLPLSSKKSLVLESGEIVLAMPSAAKTEFQAAVGIVSTAMKDIENLPVIPREIQDILVIKQGERRRWLSDGRLPSAATRTVRLAGRAKQITFHVFDPRVVEELLDSGEVDEWREDDITAAAENRRRAAYKAKLTRSLKKRSKKTEVSGKSDDASPSLDDWAEFDSEGFLR
ncbi:hypothetical protein BSY16_6252 (plasmid) [Sinorhizobium sp. RAC02]|nr:hypothetical protein BSY16_6252 [Sinorhizobium sp. RAC02]